MRFALFCLALAGLALACAVTTARAMETDQITCRSAERLDVRDVLNTVFTRAIDNARLEAELKAEKGLTPAELADYFRERVRAQFPGHKQVFNAVLKLETFLEFRIGPLGYAPQPTHGGHRVHLYDAYPAYLKPADGIRNALAFELAEKLVGYCSASTFRVGPYLFGTDKVGHFIDQGYDYWTRSSGGTLPREGVRYGTKTELGTYGLSTVGVFSYADLAANYAGYEFFRHLVGLPGDPEALDSALFLVEQTPGAALRLVPRRPFDIAQYVSADWDELLNFSVYTKAVQRMVDDHLEREACAICADYSKWRDSILREELLPRELYVDFEQASGMKQVDPYDLQGLCARHAQGCTPEAENRYSCATQ